MLPAARSPAFRLRVGLPAPPSLFPQLQVPVPASGTPASRPVVAPSRWPRAGDAGSFVSALVPASLLSPRVARGSAGSRSPCHGRHTAPAPCCRPWPATASPEHTGEGSPLTAPPSQARRNEWKSLLFAPASKLLKVTLTDLCKERLVQEKTLHGGSPAVHGDPGPPLLTKRSRKKCAHSNAAARFL